MNISRGIMQQDGFWMQLAQIAFKYADREGISTHPGGVQRKNARKLVYIRFNWDQCKRYASQD